MKKSEEKILTLHPVGKMGVNIVKARYDVVKDAIVKVIKKEGEVTFDKLTDKVEADLIKKKFDGRPLWYITTVKLDLEARKIIERVPRVSPQRLRMV